MLEVAGDLRRAPAKFENADYIARTSAVKLITTKLSTRVYF